MTEPLQGAEPEGRRNADPVPLREAIDLLEESLAFFDAEGSLVGANARFREFFAALGEFASEGSVWDIFLLEAERYGLLDAETCQALRLAEDLLAEGRVAPGPIEFRAEPTGVISVRLRATSNGGFAMVMTETIDREGQAESDRLAEVLMSKVLEACPANLTMSRVGDGQILYRTPSATELLGAGRNSRDHFARVEERADFITALLPDARVDDMRVIGRRPDGSGFPASLSARLINYRGEEVVVATMTDLTDELALQAELERQQDLAFQSEKMSALGELLASVAHELNNPLAVVVGNAMMLSEETTDEAILRRVGKLSDAADRCVRIVRTFLSMAREQPLNLVATTVQDLVDTALDASRSQSGDHVAAVEVLLPPDLPQVCVDEIQIVQVLLNLLTNAEQAMADAGIGDRIGVTGTFYPETSSVRLLVSDNGPGIPKDIRNRIFDPLFTTKKNGKGTGVGLAFCHRVLAAHGGAIQLDRQAARGAGFVIDLPAVDPD